MLRKVEGFAGYGSVNIIMEMLGIEVENVGTLEIDPDAIIAYAAANQMFDPPYECDYEYIKEHLMDKNIGWDFKKEKSSIPRMKKDKLELLYSAVRGQKCMGDISLINGDDVPDVDFFSYSFPCQDISVAGKGAGLDEDSETRSSLLWQCKKVIKCKRPRYLLMENVKNLIGKKNKPNFDKWCEWLESQGYNNYYKVINGKFCGVPQNRERVFMFSILKEFDDGQFEFQEDFDSGIRLKDILEDQVDEKYYLDVAKSEKLIRGYVERYEKVPEGCGARIVGRNPENPTSRIAGLPTEQMLEMNENDTSNTLTTVQKDNMVVEKYPNADTHTTKKVGNCQPSGKGMNGEIHDSRYLSTTITTNKGEGPKVLECKQIGIDKSINNTKEIEYANCITTREDRGVSNRQAEGTGVIEIYPNELNMIGMIDKEILNDNERQRRVYDPEGVSPTTLSRADSCKVLERKEIGSNDIDNIGLLEMKASQQVRRCYNPEGVSPTLDTMQGGHRQPKILTSSSLANISEEKLSKGVIIGNWIYFVRKLTPRECFRLMGLSDEIIDRIQATGISNSQQYKLAGNSIITYCMTFLKYLKDK